MGENKEECFKRNIVYESACGLCNPEPLKDLRDDRQDPSIYVGESAPRSMSRTVWTGRRTRIWSSTGPTTMGGIANRSST